MTSMEDQDSPIILNIIIEGRYNTGQQYILSEITPEQSTPEINYEHLIIETDNDIAEDEAQEKDFVIQEGIDYTAGVIIRCPVDGCQKNFAHESDLKKHLSTHETEKKYACPHCFIEFNRMYTLKVHLRTHTGEKPYKCTYNCSKSFRTSGDLHRHIRTHTGERPYRCSFEGCTANFAARSNLSMHERIHSGERPFKCGVDGCLKSFSTFSNYKNHLRVHSGEKPFECNTCKKHFSEYSSFYRHSKIHNRQISALVCSECNERFVEDAALTKHKGEVHHIE